MMYRALRLGKVGVVAPIASTEGALAAVFSIALGETLTVAVAVCLVVIACGVVVVTMRGRTADVHLRPSLYALVAACLFGVNLVASARAGDALGVLWTILVARIVGVAVIALPLLLRGRLRLPGPAWWMVSFSATAELVGYVSFVTGAHHGVAIPAVLASQFAAVATITSFAVFGERIGPRQVAGAAVIVAGVSVLAVLRA
jgi:drug/metabolite transporter (DMT)-like permease